MDAPQQLGYYGKIPSKGDFISCHLPKLFIDPWDQWLQECIYTSRQQLSNRWLEVYLVSPIWRFALSGGICGSSAWMGVLMPSVDQAGRHFPFTLAIPVHNSQSLLDITQIDEQWFAQAEKIALSALDQNSTLENLNQQIDDLGAPASLQLNNNMPKENVSQYTCEVNDQWRLTTTDNSPLSSRINLLLQHLLVDRFKRFSLWWTQGSELIQPSLLVSEDLLTAQRYHTLLNGDWQEDDKAGRTA